MDTQLNIDLNEETLKVKAVYSEQPNRLWVNYLRNVEKYNDMAREFNSCKRHLLFEKKVSTIFKIISLLLFAITALSYCK